MKEKLKQSLGIELKQPLTREESLSNRREGKRVGATLGATGVKGRELEQHFMREGKRV
jgi:hypothetical protein